MQLVVSAVLPIFALIGAGYLCGRRGSFGPDATDVLNRFVVTLSLPALLFLGAARVTRATAGPPAFLIVFSIAALVCFLVSFALERRAGHRIADCAIAGLGGGYANTGFMGIPLCLGLFGEQGLPPALMTSLVTISGLFALALVLIELDLQASPDIGRTLLRTGRALLRNPLVSAPLAGFAFDATGFVLPIPVLHFATLLGDAASPCALVTIGLFVSHKRSPDTEPASRAGIIRLVAIKLLLQPALTWLLVELLAWRHSPLPPLVLPPLWTESAVLLAAMPTGTGPFMLAKLYNREAADISGTILVSTLLSIVSVTILVAWLTP